MSSSFVDNEVKNHNKSSFRASILLLGWGLFSGFLAISFYFTTKSPLWNGFAISAFIFTIAQICLGFLFLFQCKRREKYISNTTASSYKYFLLNEADYTDAVVIRYKKHRALTSLMFFLGLAFVLGGAFAEGGKMMTGTGIGVSLQSGFMLFYFLFALMKNEVYRQELDIILRRRH